MIYLDHNATSPLLPEARTAWLEAEDRFPGNPSSPHRIGARAEQALDQARQRLGSLLGCSSHDIVWTSGATEACNTVLHHTAASCDADARVCISAIEHPAVVAAAQHFFRGRVEIIPVDRRGLIDLEWIQQRVSASRGLGLVAVMAANNETGVLQPWKTAQEFCASNDVPFFCDATQWCGRLPSAAIGACDFLAGSAHKFGGPRGVGFLKTSSRQGCRPLLRGGKQQDGRRAGTENVPGILAMLAALESCERRIAAGEDRPRRASRDEFERKLQAEMSDVVFNGAGAERLWNTSSFIMPEADCRHRWVVKLDKAGFAVSTGSACASGSEQPSPVLTAMGLTPNEAGRALRISTGWTTPSVEWENLLQALVRLHREIQTVERL